MKNNDFNNVNIIVIFDNYSFQKDLKIGWGFSCLVKTNPITLLFDTGRDGLMLMGNMQKLNINPQDINAVFLSHFHADHFGGIYRFLETNSSETVYLLCSFPEEFKTHLLGYGAKVVKLWNQSSLLKMYFPAGSWDQRLSSNL